MAGKHIQWVSLAGIAVVLGVVGVTLYGKKADTTGQVIGAAAASGDTGCEQHPPLPCESEIRTDPKDEKNPTKWPGYERRFVIQSMHATRFPTVTFCSAKVHKSVWVQFAGSCWSTCAEDQICDTSKCVEASAGLKAGVVKIGVSKKLCKKLSYPVTSGECESKCMNMLAHVLTVTYECTGSYSSYMRSKTHINQVRPSPKTVENKACEPKEVCCPDTGKYEEYGNQTLSALNSETLSATVGEEAGSVMNLSQAYGQAALTACDIQQMMDNMTGPHGDEIEVPESYSLYDEEDNFIAAYTDDELDALNCSTPGNSTDQGEPQFEGGLE